MPRATRRSSATRQRTAPSCRPRRIARINLHGSASARCDGPNRSDTRNTSCRCTGSCRTGGHSALIGGARRVVLPHPRQPAPLLSLLVCLYGSAKILAPKREEPRCVVRFDCWCPDRIVIGGSPDSEYLPSPPTKSNRNGVPVPQLQCNPVTLETTPEVAVPIRIQPFGHRNLYIAGIQRVSDGVYFFPEVLYDGVLVLIVTLLKTGLSVRELVW